MVLDSLIFAVLDISSQSTNLESFGWTLEKLGELGTLSSLACYEGM